MPFRERLKKTFRRTSSNSSAPKEYDPSDRTSPLYYQPGERIPYKYRRPVEPSHKAHLESFSFGSAWKRRSHASEYSPMGSRMPSRNNSHAQGHAAFDGVRVSMGSLDGRSSDISRNGSSASAASHSISMQGHHHHHTHPLFDPNHLEPIQSVQTSSRDERESPSEKLEKMSTNGALFSPNELDEALLKASQTVRAVPVLA